MRSVLLLGLLLGCAKIASAHEFFSTKITWSREISRIVFKSCAGCHREGGSAFSLVAFEEARPWAAAIKEEVLGRRMPPWGAAKGFGTFEHDRGLSQDEISLIADWVEGGAPEGQRSYLPKLPSKLPPRVAPTMREQPLPKGVLRTQLHAIGIAPRGAIPIGAQVTAELPDGRIDPLIWILEPGAAAKQDFVFLYPKIFPVGTKFTVSKFGGAWKLLTLTADAR